MLPNGLPSPGASDKVYLPSKIETREDAHHVSEALKQAELKMNVVFTDNSISEPSLVPKRLKTAAKIFVAAGAMAGVISFVAASNPVGWIAIGLIAIGVGIWLVRQQLLKKQQSSLIYTIVGAQAQATGNLTLKGSKTKQLQSLTETLHVSPGDHVVVNDSGLPSVKTKRQQEHLDSLKAPNEWGIYSKENLLQLAKMYATGNSEYNVPKDDKKAFEIYKKLADLGSNEGCEWVAKAYKEGRGVTRNLGLAGHYSDLAEDTRFQI